MTIRRGLRALLFAGVLAIPFFAATSARADEYDPQRAGHPVRILAYILHPVGVAVDYLLLRPAHWVGMREPFKTIFGHED